MKKYLFDHSTDSEQLIITMIAYPMGLSCPFALIIQYFLLLVTAAPAYIFIAPFAFMNPLEFPTWGDRYSRLN